MPVALELAAGAVQSLAAERCGPSGPVTVTARPVGADRCTATLHDQVGALVRRLSPLAEDGAEAGNPAGAERTRWRIGADELPTGATVRVTCRPPAVAERE